MKRFALIGLIFFAINPVRAGVLVDNGILAPHGMFPSVVRIANYKTIYNQKVLHFTCSGTLITPEIVLTAAHCIEKKNNTVTRVSSPEKPITPKVQIIFYEENEAEIEVINSYFSKEYSAFMERYKDTTKFEFNNRIGQFEKDLIKWQEESYLKNAVGSDIGILILSSPINIDRQKLASINCNKLGKNTKVSLVGYGSVINSSSGKNSNTSSLLHYGTNFIHSALDNLLYEIKYIQGKQSINSGDSGSPLFSATDKNNIFGIASMAGSNKEGKIIANYYTSLTSPWVKGFLKEMLLKDDVPESAKKMFKKCIDQ
jgi:secreted trypsin-like serine protease